MQRGTECETFLLRFEADRMGLGLVVLRSGLGNGDRDKHSNLTIRVGDLACDSITPAIAEPCQAS
jgi:hypothetical protein